ncbi:acyltransferase family protein [Pseudobutyrivibrio sp.]|uniref:acyltransferase family protein n=1 Tax=Pseudobutyrivibrio sp. TaxID=2014367 RepID=UPI00386A8325
MKERIAYIDSMKGLAILLMVMGHVIAWQFPNPVAMLNDDGPRSTMFLFRFIYCFHMPLLMFCSGLFVIRGIGISLKDVGMSIWKRVQSLILPSIFTGGLLWLQRGNFGYWFLWTLFQFVVITILLYLFCERIPKIGSYVFTGILSVVSIALLFIVPRLMPYQNLPLVDIEHWRLYIYFCMGIICSRYNLIDSVLSKNWVYTIALLLFGFLTYWITIEGNHIPKQSVTGCVLPISAIVLLVYLFKEGLSGASKAELWLQKLGKHSLEVYILHLFFLFPMYRVGEYVQEHANNVGGGQLVFFVQTTTSLIVSVVIVYLCYLVMNIINKSSLLSLLLLGRKSEKHAV